MKREEIDLNLWYKEYRKERKVEIRRLEANPFHGYKITKNREQAREYAKTHKEYYRELQRRRREELTDSYIMEQLRKRNIPVTQDTIAWKRAQLKLKREIRKQNGKTN